MSAAVRLNPDQVRARVEVVPDPELSMITLADLGVIRSVREGADRVMEVVVTPTYLGCPALPLIEADLRTVLADCGHPEGRVTWALSPAWTTEWISEAGRRKLAEHGIVPPVPPEHRCRSGSVSAGPARTAVPWRPGRSARSGRPDARRSWCAPPAGSPSPT